MRCPALALAADPVTGIEGMQPIFTAETQREEPYLFIGKVAEFTGATRKAIRHYEATGLLPPATRRGKYRVYSERDVFLVHMIKHAQSYGFSLAELGGLVTAKMKNNRFPLKVANALIEHKRMALRQRSESRAAKNRCRSRKE